MDSEVTLKQANEWKTVQLQLECIWSPAVFYRADNCHHFPGFLLSIIHQHYGSTLTLLHHAAAAPPTWVMLEVILWMFNVSYFQIVYLEFCPRGYGCKERMTSAPYAKTDPRMKRLVYFYHSHNEIKQGRGYSFKIRYVNICPCCRIA